MFMKYTTKLRKALVLAKPLAPFPDPTSFYLRARRPSIFLLPSPSPSLDQNFLLLTMFRVVYNTSESFPSPPSSRTMTATWTTIQTAIFVEIRQWLVHRRKHCKIQSCQIFSLIHNGFVEGQTTVLRWLIVGSAAESTQPPPRGQHSISKKIFLPNLFLSSSLPLHTLHHHYPSPGGGKPPRGVINMALWAGDIAEPASL
jgi:hypothetical protein